MDPNSGFEDAKIGIIFYYANILSLNFKTNSVCFF